MKDDPNRCGDQRPAEYSGKVPGGTGQSLTDGHIFPVQPCTDTGDERRVEEYHHKVADHVIQEQDPVKEEPGRVQETSGNEERDDEREDDKDRDDSRKDREYEEFFVIHENIPLVFTSLKLLPMLSNILTAWNAKRDEGYAAKVRALKNVDLKDLCPAPEEEEPKAQSASGCGKRETGRVCGRDNRLGGGRGSRGGHGRPACFRLLLHRLHDGQLAARDSLVAVIDLFHLQYCGLSTW